MKKAAIIFMIFFVFAANVTVASAKKTQPVVSTWLWDTNEIVVNEGEVLNFLQHQNVTDLYLQINRQIEMRHYQRFIEKASNIDIRVHALDGAPTWATRNGSKQYQPLIEWLRKYQASSTIGQSFVGLHLDVEPYILPEWNKNQQSTIQLYQQFVIDFQSLAKELNLEYGLDIPFWFDEITYRSKKFGQGLLSEWLINQSDVVTIMAYRNFANGGNGIIELAKNEIAFATTKGKKVIVAVETEISNEGSHISFVNLQTLKEEVERVTDHFSQSNSFNGMAIHHYASWKRLIEQK